jgi:hypothetical protein
MIPAIPLLLAGALAAASDTGTVSDPDDGIVFWHGSWFASLRRLMPSESGALGPGIYLTTKRDRALFWANVRSGLAEPRLYRVLVKIQKPYYWTSDDSAQHPDKVNARARRGGYDVIIREYMDGEVDEIVVLNPSSILSVNEVSLAPREPLIP